MALVAWYKLNGNVLDSTVNGNHGTIVGSPTVVNDGPFGSCYLFNPSTNDYITINNLSSFIYNTPFTFSAWIKTTGLGTGQTFNGIIGLTYGTRLYANSAGNIYISFLSTNIGSYSITSSGVNINDNIWHHVCCTYNGDVLKLYIDGSLNATSITGIIQTNTYINNGAIGLDVNDSSKYKFNGSISDVRIYDEALSIKEIKELSKAKVLHYDFNQYQEPTTNLISSMSLYGMRNITLTYIGLEDEWKKYSLSGTWAAGDTYPYCMLISSCSFTGGVTYSTSCYIKTNVIEKFLYKFTGVNYVNEVMNKGGTNFSVLQSDNSYYIGCYNFEYTSNTSQSGYLMSRPIEGTTFDPLTDFVYIKNGQIEEKDHITPFVNGTRTAQVYDKSGYDNNAGLAVSTTPTYVNDSIVNKGCYEFDGIDDFIQVPVLNINNNNKFTISFWCYCADTGVRDIFFGNYNLSNNFNIERTTSNTLRFWYNNGSVDIIIPTFTLSSLEWIHITIVYSSTGFKAYKNGVLIYENQTLTLTANVWSNIQHIGRDTRTRTTAFKGKLADFRIYSTALSEDDIKEIYQTRAGIDKNGNLYCNNIEENKYINPIVDYTSWVVGTSGVQTGFDLNGAPSENYIIESSDPFNNIIPIWEARPEGISGADGGWVTSSFNIDNTKLYRFSVWVRRTAIGNGTFYLGVNGYGSTSGVYTLANVNDTNPYFYYSSNLFTNRQDQWLLVVGYVYPYTYTGTTSPADSGVYNVDGTKIVASTTSFKWRPETTTAKHRSYLYYSTNIDTRQQWCYPRVDICDGTEPTIIDLLNGIDYKHYQITKDLISSKGINKNSSILSNEFSEVGITEGLVAYYPLNGDAKDYSGNNNHGTVYGAIKTSGIAGKKCFYFDGTDDYINSISDFNNITLDSSTLSLWVYIIDLRDKVAFSSYKGISIGLYNKSYLILSSNSTYPMRLCTSSRLNINNWNHIVVKYISKVPYVFINSIEAEYNENQPNYWSYTGTGFDIGRRTLYTNLKYFNGKIQDVRIYNRALSDKEIGILYNTFNPNINKTLQINKENIIYTKGNIKEV